MLIAEPTVDGANVLIAVGLIEGTAKFTSVRASTVFKRCGLAFRPFSSTAAIAIADARNEYLHGAGIGFSPLDPAKWWPQYWALVATLVDAQDRSIVDLVGVDRESMVGQYLEQNARNLEDRVESLIHRARQRLTQAQSGTVPARLASEWSKRGTHGAGLRYRTEARCPACNGTGVLEGEDDSNSSYEWEPGWHEDDPGRTWATITVPAEYFSCPTCHLVLDSYEQLVEAQLADEFEIVDDDPPPEPEYGND